MHGHPLLRRGDVVNVCWIVSRQKEKMNGKEVPFKIDIQLGDSLLPLQAAAPFVTDGK